MSEVYQTLQRADVHTVRTAIRSGGYRSHTAGLGAGYLQANLAIMPEHAALDFMRYCQRNPKPCPLVGVSDTGNPQMFTLGQHIDIRTDVPAYNLYRHGILDRSVHTIEELWQEDSVAFALGCSFTFERALMDSGIPVWHIDHNTTVPMFRSSIDTVPAGIFSGKMVVSMRAIPQARLDEVIAISRRYPLAHGAPVHWGDPAAIGIKAISQPDWGDPAPIPADHLPVFWACGVTPQVALEQAGLALCITHKPGHMLITDIPETQDVPVLQPESLYETHP